MDNRELQIFTVYNKNTLDHPGLIVCRQFGAKGPTANYIVSEDYKDIVAWIHGQFERLGQGAPYRIPRYENDDPNIVESWI